MIGFWSSTQNSLKVHLIENVFHAGLWLLLLNLLSDPFLLRYVLIFRRVNTQAVIHGIYWGTLVFFIVISSSCTLSTSSSIENTSKAKIWSILWGMNGNSFDLLWLFTFSRNIPLMLFSAKVVYLNLIAQLISIRETLPWNDNIRAYLLLLRRATLVVILLDFLWK